MRHLPPRHHWTLTVIAACLGSLALLAVGPWALAAIRSTGWRTYHDNSFHFQVPIPPAWHTMSLSDWHTMTLSPGGPDDYCDERGVALLPPDLQGTRAMGEYHPHSIEVGTQDNCTMLDLGHDPAWIAEPNQVMVGGISTTIYNQHMSSLEYQAATVAIGQRQFIFTLSTNDADKKADTTTFLGVLQEFKYTGP
jgi:hypothetical protein